MVLTPFDDYPIHQTAEPIAHPASGDRNHYDRYFFNGYDREGGFFFAAAMGIYPHRQVIDAAFSMVHDGVQRSVFASGRVPLDRTRTEVGPIRVEVEQPLRRLRVVVAAPDRGLEADVTFEARTPAVEEPRMTMRAGTATPMDYTRLTQWGSWEGMVASRGSRLAVEAAAVLGCRDRSWGVRPVGEQPGGAPAQRTPQFFWLWAPLNFDDRCTHLARNDDAEGRIVYQSAAVVPLLGGPDAPTFGPGAETEQMRGAEVAIDWQPGTRRSRSATITLLPWHGEPEEIRLTPLLTFQMMGIGYLNPEWGHGHWKGEQAVGDGEWKLAELDPLLPPHIHVQQLVTADAGGRRGIGVLEQLAIGPHPSGLAGMLDGAP